MKRPEEVAKHIATAARNVVVDHRVTLVPCGFAAKSILKSCAKKKLQELQKELAVRQLGVSNVVARNG